MASPERVAGSDADSRTALWISDRLKALGLEPHFDGFVASIEGRATPLQNVWAVSKGRSGISTDVILLVANRDSPPRSVQGADDNASGIASLLELARVFSLQAHANTFVFLWSDGDAYGSLGTRDFVARHPDLKIRLAVALDRVGLANASSIVLNGWSASARVAPPWLWALANSAGKDEAKLRTPLPNFVTQLLRLAVPIGGGSQAPLVAAGVPAITLSAGGPQPPEELDTVASVSAQTLRRIGRCCRTDGHQRRRRDDRAAAQRQLGLLLAQPGDAGHRHRARSARAAGPHGHGGPRPPGGRPPSEDKSWAGLDALHPSLRAVVRDAAAGILRQSALAAAEQPGRCHSAGRVDGSQSALRSLFLLLRSWSRPPCTLTPSSVASCGGSKSRREYRPVVHVMLLAVALLALLVNPFSLVIVLPAAILWPLARSGPWPVSRLPHGAD